MTQKIIHVDMDCFYAAIEMRDNPALRNKPIAVGGFSDRRGVICTSNYEARRYGVKSAMASAYALKLCPELEIIRPNFTKYREASKVIQGIFKQHTDIIEPLSLDEAYLDVTESSELAGSATLIAKQIRQEIWESQDLTASAGVAPNKFLAKIASDWEKPNGLTVITPEKIAEFVAALPVEKICGVGKVTAKKMHAMEIVTCLDLQQYDKEILSQRFGKFGARLYDLARGNDDRKVQPNRLRKSLSVEHTYPSDLVHDDDCLVAIEVLFEELKNRLRKHSERKIHKQFLKIKFNDFQLTTIECVTAGLNISVYKQLFQNGRQRHSNPIRLLGVGVHFNNDEFSGQMEFEV